MSENNNAFKIFATFLIGGVIGGGLALLFAPKPGRELRTDISQKTKELIEDGKNSSEQLWADTKEKVGNIMDGANDFVSKAKHLIVDETKKVKGAVKVGIKTFNENSTSGDIEEKSVMEQEEHMNN